MLHKNLSKLLIAGVLCVQAEGASSVLINGNFEAFDIAAAPYSTPFNATTNPNGYKANFGGLASGVTAGWYGAATTGIGWQTDQTGANDVIEIWKSGFLGINSLSGSGQYAELNANSAGALYQDVTIPVVGDVDYGFSHTNRVLGTDTMRVLITYLGTDGLIGGGDDVVEVNRQFSTTNTTTPRLWNDFAVDNAFVSVAGGTYRFSFGAVSTSGPALSEGNFLDNVRFGVGVVPEPSTALLGAFGALALLRRRRH